MTFKINFPQHCRSVVSNSIPGGPQALQSLAPNHTCMEVSSNPEDLDYLDQVCLIRVVAKLCRAVAFQEFWFKPML